MQAMRSIISEVRSAIDDRTLDRLIRERKPILFNDAQSGIVIPVFIKNELLGLLSVWEKQEHPPLHRGRGATASDALPKSSPEP